MRKFFRVVGIISVTLTILLFLLGVAFFISLHIPKSSTRDYCEIKITSTDILSSQMGDEILYITEGNIFTVNVHAYYNYTINNYNWNKDDFPNIQIYTYNDKSNLQSIKGEKYHAVTIYKGNKVIYQNNISSGKKLLNHEVEFDKFSQYAWATYNTRGSYSFVADGGNYRVEVKCTIVIDGEIIEKTYDHEFEIRIKK